MHIGFNILKEVLDTMVIDSERNSSYKAHRFYFFVVFPALLLSDNNPTALCLTMKDI